VSGEGAAAWLDRMLACRLPRAGRMTLAPMLNPRGKIIGDFSLANLGDGEYFIAGSGIAENYHLRWFGQHLGADDGVALQPYGAGLVGLAVAGPHARELLAGLADRDLSAAAFRFMAVSRMNIGMAPCLVGRVSYTGDLGYELWMAPEYQCYLLDLLRTEGKPLGIRLFGSRALNALRLEKNYGSWAREYRPIYGPLEAGLDRFVALGKGSDFVGKAAAIRERESGGKLRLRAFAVESRDADPIGDEPVWHRGEVKGWVTSGGYAHPSGVSMAMAYVPKAIADETEGWEVELLGTRLPARLQSKPLFDPQGERMRG